MEDFAQQKKDYLLNYSKEYLQHAIFVRLHFFDGTFSKKKVQKIIHSLVSSNRPPK